jgi:tight adherence protein B
LSQVWFIYAAVFVAVIVGVEGVYWLVVESRRRSELIKRRLGGEDPNNGELGDIFRPQIGLVAADNLLLTDLNEFLVQTGLRVSGGKLAFWACSLSTAIGTALFPFFSSLAISATLGLVLGPLLVVAYLASTRRRRTERFASQLPDALNLIVRSLRVGHPLGSAIQFVSKEMPDPIATEFGVAAEEISFGQGLPTAIKNVHRRVGQDDLLFVVVAVDVQNQTGGNLADVLGRLATLMRQRDMLRLKAKSLSAEGRLSAWILSAMPFILYLAVRSLSTGYFSELESSPLLAPVLLYASASLVVANLIVHRMVNFKV